MLIRPNKKISVFGVTGLKILGKVGTCSCAICERPEFYVNKAK